MINTRKEDEFIRNASEEDLFIYTEENRCVVESYWIKNPTTGQMEEKKNFRYLDRWIPPEHILVDPNSLNSSNHVSVKE